MKEIYGTLYFNVSPHVMYIDVIIYGRWINLTKYYRSSFTKIELVEDLITFCKDNNW